jgi:RNA polymerase-binding transcription factor DksA
MGVAAHRPDRAESLRVVLAWCDSIEGVNEARRRLMLQREHAVERLASLTGDYDAVVAASRDTNADDEHDPEGATIAFERAQIGALARRVRSSLEEIDAALVRLDAGRYGVCERCAAQIPEGRLAARPTARTCVSCAPVV